MRSPELAVVGPLLLMARLGVPVMVTVVVAVTTLTELLAVTTAM